MTAKITRSPGVSAVNGWLCGNGVYGATKELDEVVEECARALADSYPSFDVTIRFNSDRKSGGAWLVTDLGPDAVGLNAEIGIGAFVVTQEDCDRARELGIEPKRNPGIHITAHIGRRAISSELSHRCWGGYYHDVHESIPAAQRFVLKNGSPYFTEDNS